MSEQERAVCPVCDRGPHTASEQRKCMRVINGWIRDARKEQQR